MPNKVFVDADQIIHHQLGADFSSQTLAQSTAEIDRMRSQHSAGNHFKILVDGRLIKNVDSKTRKAAIANLKAEFYDKVGVIAGSLYVYYLANFMLKASGKDKNTKVFMDEPAALGWLKSGGENGGQPRA